MDYTKYVCDPGLQNETAFYYPSRWLEVFNESPALRIQPKNPYDYLDEQDEDKTYIGHIKNGSEYYMIFVDSQEELLEYMKYHNIEVDTETPFVWNNGEVSER